MIKPNPVVKTWYVYVLSDPNTGKPFYIGKGIDNRMHSHDKDARSSCQCSKCKTIRAIWANGKEVQKEKVLETTVELDAYAYEWFLINRYGLENLTNETDAPQGHINRGLRNTLNEPRTQVGSITFEELRIEAGLTTFELAAKAGVSLSSINRIETGKKPVKRLIAMKLLRTLNQELGMKVKLDDLSVSLAD